MNASLQETKLNRVQVVKEEWLLDYAINSMKKFDKRRPDDGACTRAEDAASITKCIWQIINSDDTLFSVVRRQGAANDALRKARFVSTLLGTVFLSCLEIDLEYLSMVDPIDRANPFVALFKRNVARDPDADAAAGLHLETVRYTLQYWSTIRRGLSDEELWSFSYGLNDAVAAIREEGRTRSFREQWRRYTRLAAKNYDSLLEMIRELFRRHQRLLVVRVDFGYGKVHQSIPYAEVRRHRVALVRYLRRMTLSRRMVFKAYALKLEHGLQKKWHFHALMFLDGNEVQRGIHHAMVFGEHWKNVITKGKGVYYNCHKNRRKYKNAVGIGKIEAHEVDPRHALEANVAGYIVKPDFYGQVMKDERDRLFFKSELREAAGCKRGRKRTKPDVSGELARRPFPFKSKRHARTMTNASPSKRSKDEPAQWQNPWKTFAQA
ncbi:MULTISPECIES: inovirus-type Gp2 protein [Burkholderia]|uniref:inovirus-type Gp2 protein n=1 Tax=Burkholderia TaxID=32008 RepID=UPI000A1C8E5E|nr:inovirus-type Gp2 protein [Burkholderia pseudomallei]OSP96988.1 hypothetical protein BOC41_11775 [Burkholderia pseudomallei]